MDATKTLQWTMNPDYNGGKRPKGKTELHSTAPSIRGRSYAIHRTPGGKFYAVSVSSNIKLGPATSLVAARAAAEEAYRIDQKTLADDGPTVATVIDMIETIEADGHTGPYTVTPSPTADPATVERLTDTTVSVRGDELEPTEDEQRPDPTNTPGATSEASTSGTTPITPPTTPDDDRTLYTNARPAASGDITTTVLNQTRVSLVRKKFREGLTPAEEEEYDRLQTMETAVLDRDHPLPLLTPEQRDRLIATRTAASGGITTTALNRMRTAFLLTAVFRRRASQPIRR